MNNLQGLNVKNQTLLFGWSPLKSINHFLLMGMNICTKLFAKKSAVY